MSVSVATTLAEQWIYNQLAADAALVAAIATRVGGGPAIYAGEADEGATYPLIVMAEITGEDWNTALGAIRTLSRQDYDVVVYGQRVGFTALDAIAKRIDLDLHGQTGVLAGGTIYGCVRQRIFDRTESRQGVMYRRIHQTYRLTLKEN
jgi:hypothetical protein